MSLWSDKLFIRAVNERPAASGGELNPDEVQ